MRLLYRRYPLRPSACRTGPCFPQFFPQLRRRVQANTLGSNRSKTWIARAEHARELLPR